MGNLINYKVCLTSDARNDIVKIKRYILNTFKYRETAEKFSKKIRSAILNLSPFSKAYAKKPYSTYLIFFVVKEDKVIVIRVLKDRMYWQSIIKRIRFLD